jgi:peptidoglycan hydrolase CwlO-like protein
MTLIELARTIGDVLTEIDTVLQNPKLSDWNWQILFALRKHLDDQQRELVGELFDQEDANYEELTQKLEDATDDLKDLIGDIKKVSSVIKKISEVAAVLDKLIGLVSKL